MTRFERVEAVVAVALAVVVIIGGIISLFFLQWGGDLPPKKDPRPPQRHERPAGEGSIVLAVPSALRY